jgi:hypothetical protein
MAFIDTVDRTAPQAVSACDGWTTHEIAAHVTGIALEVIRHLDPYLHGDPVPTTRRFEEREAPLQALEHSALLRQLDAEEERMRRVVDDVLEREPDAVIPWTGRHMAVAKFIPHLRNEHAGRGSAGGRARTRPGARFRLPRTAPDRRPARPAGRRRPGQRHPGLVNG